jgi:1-aminocyclopropane-1-carboxylate deaminase/D-cysteine desulfhydrase-like pyridoxal-dependent ACC family enzyme
MWNSAAIDRILNAPQVQLSVGVTPLERHTHPEIGPFLVKRDDLTGFGNSGVKTRKLEGMLGLMITRKIETLVIPLGNITNLGMDLVAAARQHGITVKLLIVDDPPLRPEIRQAIFAPLRPNVRLMGSSYPAAAAVLAAEWVLATFRRRRTLIAAPSPAHPAAILGPARGFLEAMRQAVEKTDALPSTVYIASASGSSVAGFALAEALMRAVGAPSVRIVAVQVVPQPLAFWLPSLVRWTALYWGLGKLLPLMVKVYREPALTSYGRFNPRLEKICEFVEERFGFSIDPIYSGKAFASFEACERQQNSGGLAAARRLAGRRQPLFWHCGYTNNWKTFRDALRIDE